MLRSFAASKLSSEPPATSVELSLVPYYEQVTVYYLNKYLKGTSDRSTQWSAELRKDHCILELHTGPVTQGSFAQKSPEHMAL